MGRKGWAGSPPADDAEARRRIIEAAVRSVESRGPAGTTLSDVAADLGIIRKTVYRYFASTEDLFLAVSEVAAERWTRQLEVAVAGIDDPRELLVEETAFIIEQLPNQPLLTLLLAGGYPVAFSERMLDADALARARAILLSQEVDWARLGYDDEIFDELIEFLIRVIHSMILAPPDPPRSGAELRQFLRRWIGPALAAQAPGIRSAEVELPTP